MARQRILILAATDLSMDGRILRQIDVLNKHADVVVLCRKACPELQVHQVEVKCPEKSSFRKIEKAWRISALKSGLHVPLFWSRKWNRRMLTEARRLGQFDAIVANDLETLPIAHAAAGHARVVFDAHEFYPGQYPDTADGRLLNQHADSLCRKYLPHTQFMMTTAQEMSDHYFQTYGVESVDVPNCPRYEDIKIRHRAADEPVRLIYHGACRQGRGIEAAIDGVLKSTSRFELFLMFAGNRNPETYRHAQHAVASSSRIHMIEAVRPAEIAARISEFDIGVSVLESNALNHHLTTANKFFESIQARLAVISGPQRAVKRLTSELQVGWSLDSVSPDAFANVLARADDRQIAEFRLNSDRAAESVCLEAYAPRIIDTVLLNLSRADESQDGTCYENAA